MKQLTCEMCGSTDLVKDGGVFVCQTCGCKYSIEEAKKMMIEGTVDVSGSTVKVDMSDKLNNLYTLARRANRDNNVADAAKYYREIRVEDPNSWEAAFYGVYFTALNCRIGQIASAANSITQSLESVMDLIIKYVPEEGKKAALSEVALRASAAGKMLFNAALNTYNDSRHSSAMSDFSDRATAALTTMMAASTVVNTKSGDYALAKKLLEESIRVCNSTEMTKKYAQVAEKQLKLLEPILRTEQAQKNSAYWAAHADQKVALEEERKSLEQKIAQFNNETCNQVAELTKERDSISGGDEAKSISKRICELNAKKDSLGIFKGKEKKAIQAQIDELTESHKQITNRIESTRKEIQSKIDEIESQNKEKTEPLRNRVAAINSELTKDR